MTAATALFMIPTALVFPALLRKANTPPSSFTLSRARKTVDKNEHQWQPLGGNEYGIMSEHDRVLYGQHENFRVALSAGKEPILEMPRQSVRASDLRRLPLFHLLKSRDAFYLFVARISGHEEGIPKAYIR